MPALPCDQGRTVLPHPGIFPNGPGITSTEAACIGYEAGLSYYLGKVLECASFCAEPYGGKEIVLGEIADGGAAGRCEMSAIGTGTIERRPVSSHHDQRQRVARGRIRCGGTVRCHTDQSKRLQRENRLHRWGTGFGALPPGSPCALHASHMVPIASDRFFQLLRRSERDLLAGSDLHHLACGRIASRARLALANL